MTKREKLNNELIRLEKILFDHNYYIDHTPYDRICRCDCHTQPGVIHFAECCNGYIGDTTQIEQSIIDLRKKLRK